MVRIHPVHPPSTPTITTMSTTVKVKALRTVHHGEIYIPKGTTGELPEALAKELVKGKRPAVEIIKEKS
jgi:hypothetical protein